MKYLLGLLIGLEICDGLVTHFLVRGGLAQEANPFLQSMVLDDNFLALKICAGILAAFLLWTIYLRWPRVALVCVSGFVLFYCVVVFWNLSLFLIA